MNSKKFLILIFLAVFSFGIAACKNTRPVSDGVPETGNVTDISAQNGGEVTVVPGDVLYLNLVGEGDSGLSWFAVGPTSVDCLTLKDHQAKNLTSADASSTSEWWFKVEGTCNVDLQFDYGMVGEEIKETFKVKIISQ